MCVLHLARRRGRWSVRGYKSKRGERVRWHAEAHEVARESVEGVRRHAKACEGMRRHARCRAKGCEGVRRHAKAGEACEVLRRAWRRGDVWRSPTCRRLSVARSHKRISPVASSEMRWAYLCCTARAWTTPRWAARDAMASPLSRFQMCTWRSRMPPTQTSSVASLPATCV